MVRVFLAGLLAAAVVLTVSPHSKAEPRAARAGAQTRDTESTATAESETAGGTTSASARTVSRPLLATTPLPNNPQLVARLQALLPRDMSVEEAARGFVDQEEFVAAVHASRNLGVTFRTLRARMVTDEMDLGEAIQALKPDADVDREVKRAHRQAVADLKW